MDTMKIKMGVGNAVNSRETARSPTDMKLGPI